MPKYTKPTNPNLIWAQEALSANIEKPSDDKIKIGWLQEKPPFEHQNWLTNHIQLFLAYYNQLGFPEWDSNTEYQSGKSYVQGSDGIVYKAKVTNTGNDPSGAGRDLWGIAFLPYDSVSSFGRSLIDDTSASQARQTLGLGTAATQDDKKYLDKTKNLSDVGNASTAFNNIKQKATTERTGVVELATKEEVLEASRDDVAVTPSSLGGMNPAGSVITFAGPVAPVGYLECDGRLLLRHDYPQLFTAIGTTYGPGDGSTTFRIPDLRGQFIRGWDKGRGLDNNRVFGSNQADQIKSHQHTGKTNGDGSHKHTGNTSSDGNHRHSITGNDNQANDQPWAISLEQDGKEGNIDYTNYAGNHKHTLDINDAGLHTHTFTTNSTGGNETRPTNVAMMFCIKT